MHRDGDEPSSGHKPPSYPGDTDVVDLVGVGFGPSNLALAVCLRERYPELTCWFLERNPTFQWHPGMLIEGARMQVSFLKDLVTLRNLSSPYTFLQYTKARGRLEEFVNLNEFRPTRIEYLDYLRWVAADFSDLVCYGAAVEEIRPVLRSESGEGHLFQVAFRDQPSGSERTVLARNLVYAAGGRPSIPEGIVESDTIIHSSRFLFHFPATFPDRDRPYEFVVAGAGQSAGEVVEYLLDRYPEARVHLVISGYALRPTDNSPFVNEQFYSWSSSDFYGRSPQARRLLGEELANANYGVVREDLIDRLYQQAYQDLVAGRKRLEVHGCARLIAVESDGPRHRAVLADRFEGRRSAVSCDGVVLSTGYERALPEPTFEKLLPHMRMEPSGVPEVTRSHRVELDLDVEGGLYLQGQTEASFGLGDSLLSLLPFRAHEIADAVAVSVRRRAPEVLDPSRPYPPGPYLEDDQAKLLGLIERFKFATLVSARDADEPRVTQLPIILQRRPSGAVLVGHMDRANPHVQAIEGCRALVLFHGPNAYISPRVYETDQLPTWNSMTVRVRGRARLVRERDAIVRILEATARACEPLPTLDPEDPRIDQLVGYIVGVEIDIEELTGRFKLSQEQEEADRRNAAAALLRRTEEGERDFIEYVVGLPLG